MDLETQIASRYRREVDVALLRRVIERVLAGEGIEGKVEISLLIGGDAAIRKLNASYRGVDSVTDVLSFPLQAPEDISGESAFIVPPDDVLRLGDIVLSFPRAKEQAVRYGHSLKRELAYLTVHGVLHLLGYDHEDEADRQVMRAKEEAALRGEEGMERTGG